MGPLDKIMHRIDFINIHLVRAIHAAKDRIEKTDSVYYVNEAPSKLIRVIMNAPHDLLGQQILNQVQMTLSFESYAQKDTIIANLGHNIVMIAHNICTES